MNITQKQPTSAPWRPKSVMVLRLLLLICLASCPLACTKHAQDVKAAAKKSEIPDTAQDYQKPYLDLLEDVYDKMDKNYYKPVSKEVYLRYVEKFKALVLGKMKDTEGRIDDIAYHGAGLLVNKLKDSGDTFTNFIPPQIAKEYSKEIYGYENGIGISGNLTGQGYVISHVQIRSDAYLKGLRASDIVLKINGENVQSLTPEAIKQLLYPPLETKVVLEAFQAVNNITSLYEVTCEEYFIETIIEVPVDIPGAYCLKITSFNRKTGEDLNHYINILRDKDMKLLILDLRGNPGGPPLAVRELSGIFFPEQTKLFYYKKKNVPEFGLVSPPSDVKYGGKMVLLINKGSGSSSEILAGLCKVYHRALVAGKEPTAGFAFLKSAFNYEDGSMLAMITGLTYLSDGTELTLDGVMPDYTIPSDAKDELAFVIDKIKKGEWDVKNINQQ